MSLAYKLALTLLLGGLAVVFIGAIGQLLGLVLAIYVTSFGLISMGLSVATGAIALLCDIWQ
ncbi:hypothetical protein CNR37_00069 [Pseudomonas phage ventosus]|uniref:Uncharacterized protein n=1 Tax=Pseudomonas phage ventosus TaxID=2048980 RepID=A0A2H4P7W9_9CAUD|nr:hypothetical protein CNR37_00069 [Pseudomonas phage ventosus]